MSTARSASKLELSYDTSEVADKLQSLRLNDHGKKRMPRIGIRVRRRRRVRLLVSPLLGYLRGLLHSLARSAMDRSRLGLRRLSSKRARRIHSVRAAHYESDEQAQPLLECIQDS